jgi:F0F1-type ATP synthase delta subunit
MKMKFILPVGCLALGIAIGLMARSAPSTGVSGSASERVTASVSTSRTAGKATQSEPGIESAPAARPARPDLSLTKNKVETTAEETTNKMPSLEQMKQQMAEIEREKFETRFSTLSAGLNLSPEQQAKIRATMDESLKKMGGDATNSSVQMMKIGSLDNVITSVLSEDQQAALTTIKAKHRQNRIESKALKSLADLTMVLDLNEEQKDAVYGVLSEQVVKQEEVLGASGVARISNMRGTPIEKTADSNIAEAVLASLVSPEDLEKRTNERVEAMRSVLNERQLQQYRTYLQKKPSGGISISKPVVTPPGK